ncbi:MAG: adenylate/guanylate cyclase domain-containing protein [Clostridia bacterium]|nr:adenylate/guanylate cyclase domain-containing protein [Clostridia bacterium]
MKKRGLLLNLLIIVILLLLPMFSLLQSVDYRLQDKLYQRLSLVSPNIFVIGIDEETLAELGPFQDWKRDNLAELIEVLTADSESAPAVIGVDIGFYGNRSQSEDQHLVQSIKNAVANDYTEVVLSSFASFGNTVVEADGDSFYLLSEAKTLENPIDSLLPYVTVGHSNVMPDSDGIIRRSLHQFNFEGQTIYSFAYEIYKAYTGSELEPPLSGSNQWYIPYSGKPMDYYGTQGYGSSMIRVLNKEYPTEVFAGSIVLIGPYSAGLMDSYYTPVSRSEQMNGVEIHANIVQALLEANFKKQLPPAAGAAATALLILIILLLTAKLDFRIAGIGAFVLSIVYLLSSYAAYQSGYIIQLIYPLLGVWLIYLFRVFYNYWHERRERKRMMEIYSRYLSPQVAKSIAVSGDSALALGGQKKDIAVLFVDIRGFTTISESLGPEEVVAFLNHYLDLTTRSIFANEGTVDKFIGDATMAVFNAPFDLDDYVYKAVKTGLDMVEGARQLEKELTLASGAKVGFGVGINCGEAVVGNIGTSFRMEYTAIGDTVNTASRLEGQAGPGEVIVSRAVIDRVGNRFLTTCLGERKLKGKAGEISVYRIDGIKDNIEGD